MFKLLAEELHKPVKRKFPRRAVVVQGIDHVWSLFSRNARMDE